MTTARTGACPSCEGTKNRNPITGVCAECEVEAAIADRDRYCGGP